MSMKRNSNNRLRNAVAFPGTAQRGHASPASSSDAGSPRARRRISGNTTLVRPQTSQLPQIHPPRAPLSRIESASSATLFFGPPIPPTQTATRSRTNTNLSAATPAPVLRRQNTRGNLTNRHSYAGPESSANALHVWNTFQTRTVSPSPGSSPCHVGDGSHHHDTDMEADEDMFFGPEDSSFVLNVTSGTPSPQSKTALPMKFKHRNSVLVSDEEEMLSTGSSAAGDILQAMPKASTSVSSFCSDDGLVTPGVAPEGFSGWPTAAVYNGADDLGDNQHPYGLTSEAGVDIDAFILRTLAAASKGPHFPLKRIPGTPVKKARISYFGNERPWQSAVASKVGLRDDCSFNKKVPRKSLPAAFPPTEARASKLACDQTTDSEDEQDSPITRRDKYSNLGLGQPPLPAGKNVVSGIPRSRWLMRRSSSGAFSSGSDSASLANTPTRSKGIGKSIVSILHSLLYLLTDSRQIGNCLNPEFLSDFLHQAIPSRSHLRDLTQDRPVALSPHSIHLRMARGPPCRHLVVYLDSLLRGPLLLRGDYQIPSQRNSPADLNVTLLRSRKSEAENLEKSSKFSEKAVTTLNYMLSRNLSDLKGPNIGKRCVFDSIRFISSFRAVFVYPILSRSEIPIFVAREHANFFFGQAAAARRS